MASSRRTATNENISTYDSAGGKDYSTLAAWEQATDINLVSASQSEVLECYKGAHLDADWLDGATTDASYYRIIRPASGEGHSGIPLSDGSVVEFHVATQFWQIREPYSALEDLVITSTANDGITWQAVVVKGSFSRCVGLLLYDLVNAGVGSMWGFLLNITTANKIAYFINCLIHNDDDYGFVVAGAGQIAYVYNCTFHGTDNGVWAGIGTTIHAKNTASVANTNDDWIESGTINFTTCTSEGASPTFKDVANDDFHLAEGDTVCRGNGTDLSGDGNYAFDDDIDFETRSAWDIGFDEFSVSAAIARLILNTFKSELFGGVIIR